MVSRRFGWHSGSITCQNISVKADMTISGNLSFGDASVDTLTINGTTTIATNNRLRFRDSANYVTSSASNIMNIVAGTTIAMSGAVTMDSTLGVTSSIGAASISVTGVLGGASVSVTGAVGCASVSASGTVAGNALTSTTSVSAASATINGDITLVNGETIGNAVNGYVLTDGAFRVSGVGGAGVASTVTLQYSETAAGIAAGTLTNCPAAGDPVKWMDVWFGTTKYVVPLFASA